MTATELLDFDSNNRLIIVEDDRVFRERLARAFKHRDFQVSTSSNLSDLALMLENQTFDYAIIDLKLGSEINNCESGLKALSLILKSNLNCRALILTGYGTIASAVEAVKMGAVQYLTKPSEIDEILKAFDSKCNTDNLDRTPDFETSVSTLAQTEWEHIQSVLKFCSGNISMAAKQLGLHRRSLQRKLAKSPVNLK